MRFAVRSLLRSPAFSATVVLTVALGIGVNTAVFNLIYTVLLDPLPFRNPEQLVHLAETHPDFPAYQVAAPDFFDWRKMAASFDGIAAYTFQEMNKWTITGGGAPEPVQMVQASYSLFPLLGIQPLIGRTYTAEEEARKAPVILIGESLWRRRYGADPSIVGRTIRLIDWPVTVVGVIPQRQAQPSWAQVWMPLSFLDPALTETRRFHTLEVIARLKSGVGVQQAQAEMSGIAGGLARAYPVTNGKVGVDVLPLSLWATGEVRPALLIAWAAVSLVLLLACTNVAHLVLVRIVHRSREIAMRLALGSGPARITRFLLAENFLLAIAGGTLGAILAAVLWPFLQRISPVDIPELNSPALSLTALLFGSLASILCASLFALPAVIHSRRLNLQQVVKPTSGLSLTHRRSWFGPSIIAAEVAMAFVVMTGAGLLYKSFVVLLDEKTGFDSHGVLAVEIPLPRDWSQPSKEFEHAIAPRLREIPGVTSVAAANCGPMMLDSSAVSRFSTRFGVAGQAFDPANVSMGQLRWTSVDYFRTLRIPLQRGRLFTDADTGKPGYIINETLARRFFPNQDPVGRQLLKNIGGPSPTAVPIIGVVGDVRDLGLNREPGPTLYELGVSSPMTILIRGHGSATPLIPAVRAAIRAASPQDAITTLAPLDRIIQASLARRRFALELLGIFATLGAALATLGIYGVVSYSLSRRTSEFAIRFALGAEPRHVRRLILRGFAVPAVAGLLAGGWLAYSFALALRTQLYKTSPADPLVLAISAIILLFLVIVSASCDSVRASPVRNSGIHFICRCLARITAKTSMLSRYRATSPSQPITPTATP
ncbi:MAG: ABC transporter permease [Bryobacteraceae bacterium]